MCSRILSALEHTESGKSDEWFICSLVGMGILIKSQSRLEIFSSVVRKKEEHSTLYTIFASPRVTQRKKRSPAQTQI